MRLPTNLLALLAGFLMLPSIPHYKITLSDSLPRGIYQEVAKPLAHGVIVAECLPLEWAQLGKERGWLDHGDCPGDVTSILKQVAGLPGDEVEIADEYVAINGTFLPNTATQKRDRKGRAIPTIARGTFTLKEDEIFLLATNSPASWDGRYTGQAKVKDVIATFAPVITEVGNGL